MSPAESAMLARRSDVVIVVGIRLEGEGFDNPANPPGRLPITFPADLAQTPRPKLEGLGTPWGTPTTIRYDEGAEVHPGLEGRLHLPEMPDRSIGLLLTTRLLLAWRTWSGHSGLTGRRRGGGGRADRGAR